MSIFLRIFFFVLNVAFIIIGTLENDRRLFRVGEGLLEMTRSALSLIIIVTRGH